MKLTNSLIKLTPHIVEKVWGGSRLAKLKTNINTKNLPKIGETWEISIHKDGPSAVNGTTLDTLVNEVELPYLFKLIDTNDFLSIQVHPDDEYAGKYENSSGKTECWIILDAEDGAGIYLGFKKGVTKEVFDNGLAGNEDISKYLQFHPVNRGDFFFVPAGTIHAIGKGVFLAEIQQSSGITYRVWDWNRPGDDGLPRDLHVKQALDVLRFEEDFNSMNNFRIKRDVFAASDINLIEHDQFVVKIFNVEKKETIHLSDLGRHAGILCAEGNAQIQRGKEKVDLDTYESILLSRGEENRIDISGKCILILVE